MKDTPKTVMFNTFAIEGMSLRDYFAAKAMQAMLNWEDVGSFNVSKEAYMMADAMMEVKNASI